MEHERVKFRRDYDNARRAEQARRTRAGVLAAAHDLLIERGYAGTTMAAVAAAAGVSVETVYKVFGTKAALVKRVYDVTLAGDEAPLPLAARPEMLELRAEPDPRAKLQRYARIARTLAGRLAPLVAALLAGARSGNPELRALVATLDAERLAGATALVGQLADGGGLRPDLAPERARDILWTLISPDVCRLLVEDRGWTLDDYECWLAKALQDALLGPPARDGPQSPG